MQAGQKFAGKVALITGGTDGLGLASALRLGQLGASVAVCGRSPDKLQLATETMQKNGIDCLGIRCHIGDSDSRKSVVQQTVDKFGGIDFFIQSAAVNPRNGRFLEVNESKFDHIFNVNLKASFSLTQLVYPIMKQRGGGSIVYFSSSAGNYPGKYSGYTVYSLSKSALNNLARFLGPELGEANITVNSLSLGAFKTAFAKDIHENPHVVENLYKCLCVERLGELNQVTSLVEYLCSEDGSYTTGSTIDIDGGTKVQCI